MNNTQVKSAKKMIDICWGLTLTFAVCICAGLLPDMALAGPNQDSNAIQQVFCNVVTAMTGLTGKAIATVAIIAVGVGALLGKISWGMALIVTLGIGLIFGAATIVNMLGGNSGSCTATFLPNTGGAR